jgi:L-threonylcarbamoyladenylate synthase
VLDGLAGRIAAVLDSGACDVGVESTVLDLTGAQPVLLRPGGATIEAIELLVGQVARGIPHAVAQAARTLRSPGLLVSHYAPDAPVRLNADAVRDYEALLAFGPELPGAGVTFQLSASRDLTEAAANLFVGLRRLDAEAARLDLADIAVMPLPEHGLGLAINDRLRRAAAPRTGA